MVIPNKVNSKVIVNGSHILKAKSLSNELLELLDLFFYLGKKKKIIHIEYNKYIRTRSFKDTNIIHKQVKIMLLCPFNCMIIPEKKRLL